MLRMEHSEKICGLCREVSQGTALGRCFVAKGNYFKLGITSVVECLSGMHEALGLIPRSTKTNILFYILFC
jgi:hypothetical protein